MNRKNSVSLTINSGFHHILAKFHLRCVLERLHAVAILTSLRMCSLHHRAFHLFIYSRSAEFQTLFSLDQLKVEPAVRLIYRHSAADIRC